MRRSVITVIAALLLAAMTATAAAGCVKKKPAARQQEAGDPFTAEKGEILPDEEAKALFSAAMEKQVTAHCRASAKSYAICTDEKTGETTASYLQTFDRLIANEGATITQSVSSSYAAGLKDPAAAEEKDLSHFFDCYIHDAFCYVDYNGEKRIESFYDHYLCRIGLYALTGLSPSRMQAVKTGTDVVVTMSFSGASCRQAMDPFITTMSLAIFSQELDLGISPVIFKAHVDPESGQILSYVTSFDALPTGGEIFKMHFVFSERFTDYGTADKPTAPNISEYVSVG